MFLNQLDELSGNIQIHVLDISLSTLSTIENHLDKTPNEYIRWRFQFGDDREGLDKATMKLTDEESKRLEEPIEYTFKTESGQIKKEKRVISKLTGQRRETEGRKKDYEYETTWKDKGRESNSWILTDTLIKYNKLYEKLIKQIDQKISARENMFSRPLTQQNVEKHLNYTGLEPEYASHFRINALSGGQKVKVVLPQQCGINHIFLFLMNLQIILIETL